MGFPGEILGTYKFPRTQEWISKGLGGSRHGASRRSRLDSAHGGLRLGQTRIEWRFIPGRAWCYQLIWVYNPERFDMRTGCMRAGCGLIPGKTTTRTEHSMAQAADLGWIRHMLACG